MFWIHPAAKTELEQAIDFYRRKASAKIAEAFLQEFEQVREFLVRHPLASGQLLNGLRIRHFSRFPYSVVYEAHAELGPQIYAVAHQRREPEYWVSRLDH
jgi:plasmid stabilization system protein ParE